MSNTNPTETDLTHATAATKLAKLTGGIRDHAVVVIEGPHRVQLSVKEDGIHIARATAWGYNGSTVYEHMPSGLTYKAIADYCIAVARSGSETVRNFDLNARDAAIA